MHGARVSTWMGRRDTAVRRRDGLRVPLRDQAFRLQGSGMVGYSVNVGLEHLGCGATMKVKVQDLMKVK